MSIKTQLVTYINRFGQADIAGFHHYLKQNLGDVFGGVHLLPFFYPIDGDDAGYDPVDNGIVDSRLGTWGDINHLSKDFDVMADMIVNHISAESPQFLDVKKNGSKSKYFDLFLRKKTVFEPHQEEDIKKVFRPKPTAPFTEITTDTGERILFWTTFGENQIDIDVESEQGIAYIKSTLKTFAENGINFVRLDAVGFTIKRAGTSCFLLPETYAFMEKLKQYAHELGMTVLVEVHAHFKRQIEAAKHVDFAYDFALPPLVLYSLATNHFGKLKDWISMRPKNCFNVLDTHDGIGVNDVEADWEYEGFLNEEEATFLLNYMHDNTKGTSRKASGTAAQNLDVYHVNSGFYDVLGQDDFQYTIARAIQFFLPGVPQIYYGGFLALENDMTLLAETNVGRDINRSYLSFEQISEALQKPIVQEQIKLIKLRNSHPSFSGKFEMLESKPHQIHFFWKKNSHQSTFFIDLEQGKMEINYTHPEDFKQTKTIVYGSFSTSEC